jgi:hypothetical protein
MGEVTSGDERAHLGDQARDEDRDADPEEQPAELPDDPHDAAILSGGKDYLAARRGCRRTPAGPGSAEDVLQHRRVVGVSEPGGFGGGEMSAGGAKRR